MSNTPYIQYLPYYLSTSMTMLEMISICLSIACLVYVNVSRDRINRSLYYCFTVLLSFVLLFTLWFFTAGIF
ncbi:MAG: hypothetical protein HY318_06975 [Armatimonadetes bacterium]|nr:hypothetical protein [Armatimonadota bacterium]